MRLQPWPAENGDAVGAGAPLYTGTHCPRQHSSPPKREGPQVASHTPSLRSSMQGSGCRGPERTPWKVSGRALKECCIHSRTPSIRAAPKAEADPPSQSQKPQVQGTTKGLFAQAGRQVHVLAPGEDGTLWSELVAVGVKVRLRLRKTLPQGSRDLFRALCMPSCFGSLWLSRRWRKHGSP